MLAALSKLQNQRPRETSQPMMATPNWGVCKTSPIRA